MRVVVMKSIQKHNQIRQRRPKSDISLHPILRFIDGFVVEQNYDAARTTKHKSLAVLQIGLCPRP
jgi:hypothetical protein